MRAPRPGSLISLLALVVTLGACSTFDGWFGESEDPPLPGDRISVLNDSTLLEGSGDPALTAVTLPPVRTNPDWRNPGGAVSHVNGNLALDIPFQRVWSTSIGSGSDSTGYLINPPIVADGRVYATDSDGRVTALDFATGGRIWRVRATTPDEGSRPLGGGVAFADGLLYASTGFGEVLALDPTNGASVWTAKVGNPVRGAPTVTQGRVLVITLDNQTEALDGRTGAIVWTHAGLVETSTLLSGTSPAVEAGTVVSAYSSGEIYGLQIENGLPVWGDSLAGSRVSGAQSNLPVIAGLPVIDGELLVASSQADRTVGVDMRSGFRVWEQPIGSTDTPLVAGDTVFVVSKEARLIALARNTGQVRWVRELPQWSDPEDKSGPIAWHGPILANDTLIVASSVGSGMLVSARTGEVVGDFDAGPTDVAPIVVDGTLLILERDGYLTAYR
jgi:outer membrane protein assembly factor BamB